MQKWEYEFVLLDKFDAATPALGARKMTRLYGQKGWELVQIIGGVAYFKRPLRAEAAITDINVHPEGENLGPYPHVSQGVYGD